MGKIDRALAFLHRAVLAYLAILSIPALLALLLLDPTPAVGRVMERLTPLWGWLMGAWFLSAVYFCACLVLSGGAQYVFESGSLFGPDVSRTFFALAALQVLLFHLFARRVRA